MTVPQVFRYPRLNFRGNLTSTRHRSGRRPRFLIKGICDLGSATATDTRSVLFPVANNKTAVATSWATATAIDLIHLS